MDFNAFKNSLLTDNCPSGISVHLQALWYDAKDNWNKAHEIIQVVPDKSASWIHAYFHRKEGDIPNADYWYQKAERDRPSVTLNQEWEEIVANLVDSK